jgi:hypothetical protein
VGIHTPRLRIHGPVSYMQLKDRASKSYLLRTYFTKKHATARTIKDLPANSVSENKSESRAIKNVMCLTVT